MLRVCDVWTVSELSSYVYQMRHIACMLVLVVFMFSISYVTNLALWLREFNKLTYLLIYLLTSKMFGDEESLLFSITKQVNK